MNRRFKKPIALFTSLVALKRHGSRHVHGPGWGNYPDRLPGGL